MVLPDTVIITDMYGYILEFNKVGPFPDIKKGRRVTRYLKSPLEEIKDDYHIGERVYQRTVSRVTEKGRHLGYIIILTDITEKMALLEQNRIKNRELRETAQKLAQTNEELAAFARQVRELSDYTAQLRIARSIHDDLGHDITAIHAISQMCLKLRDENPQEYKALIGQGLDICRRAFEGLPRRRFSTVEELLEAFRRESQFPVEISVSGGQPAFAEKRLGLIYDICKEACHNTMEHSLAEKMTVDVKMDENSLTLCITDDGCFHGSFEKGFGLMTMEENVVMSGGSIDFCAIPGQGFNITAAWSMEQ